jgi:hypothetical protein
MIRFGCPKCQQVMQVDDRYAGQVVACPACKTAIRAPAAAPPPSPPVAAPQPPSTPSVSIPLPPALAAMLQPMAPPAEASRLGPAVRELRADQNLAPYYATVLGGVGFAVLVLLIALYQLAAGDLGIFCVLFAFLLVPLAVAAFGANRIWYYSRCRAYVYRDGFACVTPREAIVLAWNEVENVRHELHEAYRLGAKVGEAHSYTFGCRGGRQVVLGEMMPFSAELGRMVEEHTAKRMK